MRNLIVILAFAIGFSACKKEAGEGGTSVIEGKVYKIDTYESVINELDSLGNIDTTYKIIDTLYYQLDAGKDVFIVDNDMFHDCRMGKKKYHRYEKYVGTRKVGQAIREYGLKYPKRPIILQNGENGPMLYLRYGGS